MKKFWKIFGISIGAAIVLFIVGFVLTAWLTLSGIGNPIKRYVAQKHIEEYVAETYPDMETEKIKVIYNFKFSGYGATIKKVDSIDTYFYVSYDDGEFYDSYEEDVLKGYNTYRRVTQGFNDYVDAMYLDEYGDEAELVLYDLYSYKSKNDGLDKIKELVPLDGDLDIKEVKNLGMEPEITVWFVSDDISYDNMAKKFIETKAFMEANDVYATVYSLRLKLHEEHPDRFDIGIHVYDFPVELIGTDEMIDKIIEYDEKGKEIPDGKE